MTVAFNPIKYLLRLLRPGTDIKAKKTADALTQVSGRTVTGKELKKLHNARNQEEIITKFLPVFYERDKKIVEEHSPKNRIKKQARDIVIATLDEMAKLTTLPKTFSQASSESKDTNLRIMKLADLRKLEIETLQAKIKDSITAQKVKLKKIRPYIKACLERCQFTLREIAEDKNIMLLNQ